MKENTIQINGEITINVDVSVKNNVKNVEKNISGILLHLVVEMEKL